ncbi:hypothetical protein M758_10G066400 [Ceratodon purpureus]|nr:hypothetical protein M758_10G066400 [Ceratodon purpureus]
MWVGCFENRLNFKQRCGPVSTKLKLMNFVTASQTDAEIESVPSETQQKQEVYDDRPLHQITRGKNQIFYLFSR